MTDFIINIDPPGIKEAHAAFNTRLENEPELLEWFHKSASCLTAISYLESDLTETRVAFLTEDPDLKADIRKIGRQAHAQGGLVAMHALFAYCTFKGPSDARTLEFAWDGIGDWRA